MARNERIPPNPAETFKEAQRAIQTEADKRMYPTLRSLFSFLREPAQLQEITGKGDSRTNIIDQNARVTYALPPGSVNKLLTHLEEIRRDGLTAHFSERQGTPETPDSGLMLDFDLQVLDEGAALTEKQAHRLSCRVLALMHEDLYYPEAGGDITVHTFTIVKPKPVPLPPAPSQPALFKYGFHLLVPSLRLSREYKKHLLTRIQEDRIVSTVLGEIGATAPRESLDMNSASVPVMFLGSCKRGGEPYELGPVFETAFEPATEAGGSPPFAPMVKRLAPVELEAYNLVAESSLCFEAAYPKGRPPLVQAHAPRYRPDLAEALAAHAARAAHPPGGEMLHKEHELSTLAVYDPEARFLHEILDLLDDSYHTDRNRWRDVIYALANTSESYKPLAEWFSRKCPEKWGSGGQEALDALWAEAVGRRHNMANPLTKRSLLRWAQLCNPQRYKQVSNQNYYMILSKYVYEYEGVLEHAMVADVLYAMLGTKFVVDVDEGGGRRSPYVWFEFVVPGQSACPGEVWKWRREAEPDELHKYISHNLVKVFDQMKNRIDENRADADGDEQKVKYYSALGKAFMLSRRKIFNDTFKNGVIRQANYIFRRRNFIASLDQDPLFIGVGNGVLQLGRECRMIDHFHEYPIMKHTPVVFAPFDPEEPWTKKMLNAIADIIPERDFRDWLLYFAASSLAGGVKEGLLLLWHGGGANGKTWVMRMIAKVLGKHYATKLDIGLLTAERSKPNEPNSAMMQLKGCRWGYVEETQKAEPLNSQRLKEIVNPGEVSGSEKFKQQETFENTANIAVGQNYDFVVDTTDHGTWRRLYHYHSKVRFCANPEAGNPFEKKDDQRYIREYINTPKCQTAFLSILVHYYERLHREHGGLLKKVPCPTLARETEAFRNSQDTLNRFITQNIVVSPSGGHEYSLASLAQMYHEWYDKNIDRRRHVASETIQDLENSALGKFIKRAANRLSILCGCRLLAADDQSLASDEEYIGAAANDNGAPPPIAQVWDHSAWWEPPDSGEPPPPEDGSGGAEEGGWGEFLDPKPYIDAFSSVFD